MKKVTDIFTRESYDPNDYIDDLPVFKGQIQFEEHPSDLDFANELVQTAMQLPERSKRNFLNGLNQLSELSDYAMNSGNTELIDILCKLGFLNKELVNVKR